MPRIPINASTTDTIRHGFDFCVSIASSNRPIRSPAWVIAIKYSSSTILCDGSRQHQFAQITQVRHRPTALAAVLVVVTQQERFQPIAAGSLIAHGVGARPTQIADRFVARIGHVDRRQFSRPVETSQLDRIAAIGFDSIPALLGNQGGRHHLALDPQLVESAINPEPAGPGFVDEVQDDVRATSLRASFSSACSRWRSIVKADLLAPRSAMDLVLIFGGHPSICLCSALMELVFLRSALRLRSRACGFGIYRRLHQLGVECKVVAPLDSQEERGSTSKPIARDAIQLARLDRAGELTAIYSARSARRSDPRSVSGAPPTPCAINEPAAIG